MTNAAFCVATALGLFGWLFLSGHWFTSMSAANSVVLALTALVGGGAALLLMYRRCAVHFPDGAVTAGDLARITVTPTSPHDHDFHHAAERAVLDEVRRACADLVAMDVDDVNESTRLAEDLGFD